MWSLDILIFLELEFYIKQIISWFISSEYAFKLFTCILNIKWNVKKIDFYSLFQPFIWFPLMLYGCHPWLRHMTLATLTRSDLTFYIIIFLIISIRKQSLFFFPKKHTFWKTSRLLTSIIELFTPYHFTKLTRNETHNVKLQIHSNYKQESLWHTVSRTHDHMIMSDSHKRWVCVRRGSDYVNMLLWWVVTRTID